MPTTLPKPKDRPGAPLFPEDRARDARVTEPDASGTTCGIGWAVWETEYLNGETALEAALYSEDGRIYRKVGPAGGGTRKAHHTFDSVDELRAFCLRWRMRQEINGDPLTEVQDQIRLALDRKVRGLYWKRRQPDVETHTRKDGGRITFHHSVID